MSMGNYDEAIAVAPKVNLKFWQNCIDQYKSYLQAETQTAQTSFSQQEKDPASELIDY